MRNKRAFVPSSLDGTVRLEDRVVLSGGVAFYHGAAVLTPHAYSKTVGEIRKAFTRFATHGQDAKQLTYDLTKAVGRIPYHRVSGLDDAIPDVVAQLQDDIASGVSGPVKGAYQNMLATLKDNVRGGIDSGTIVVR